MPKERVNLRKILPAGFAAVHTTASGRKGATRWNIYDSNDVYRGDLVRWVPENDWTWQPYSDTPPYDAGFVEGTIEVCATAIHSLAS